MEAILKRKLTALNAAGKNPDVFVNSSEKDWNDAIARMENPYPMRMRNCGRCAWNVEAIVKEVKRALDVFEWRAERLWYAYVKVDKKQDDNGKDVAAWSLYGTNFVG